jgi:DNA-binding transcriptional ArsR family regulator
LEVDWSSLHKILSDTTRRSILELLSEKGTISYTEIMTLLHVTNTGRLNYHLRVLGNLISKDDEGRYHLTEKGQLAVNLLRTFPERIPVENRQSKSKILVSVTLIVLGLFLIVTAVLLATSAGSAVVTSSSSATVGTQLISPNSTILVTSLNLPGGSINFSWAASSPIRLFVLNTTQYGSLLLQHSTGNQVSSSISNFTGEPASWVSRYYRQNGDASLTVQKGTYYFFASSTPRALLIAFDAGYSQQEPTGGPLPLLFYLPLLILTILGVLPIILAFLILTRRIWR